MEKPSEFKYVTKTIIESSVSISVKELMDALHKAGIPEEKWKDVEIETGDGEYNLHLEDTLKLIKVNFTYIHHNENYDAELKEYQLYIQKIASEEDERKRLSKIVQESLDAKRAWKIARRAERILARAEDFLNKHEDSLSKESAQMLADGIASAKTEPVVYLGSFSKRVDIPYSI